MKRNINKKQKPILAVSSGGGHWIQLLRLRPVWDTFPVVYASVDRAYRNDVYPNHYFVIPDGNRNTKAALLKMLCVCFILVVKIRPSVVISTGAAPGFFAVICGKIFGARTVWVDSIANAERLSLCGKAVRPFADLRLTQWKELSTPKGPYFHGSII